MTIAAHAISETPIAATQQAAAVPGGKPPSKRLIVARLDAAGVPEPR